MYGLARPGATSGPHICHGSCHWLEILGSQLSYSIELVTSYDCMFVCQDFDTVCLLFAACCRHWSRFFVVAWHLKGHLTSTCASVVTSFLDVSAELPGCASKRCHFLAVLHPVLNGLLDSAGLRCGVHCCMTSTGRPVQFSNCEDVCQLCYSMDLSSF